MTHSTNGRAAFASRLGFILSAAGSAIGLGAIWKFPYMTGANGGGAFLLLYLVAVLGIGLALMAAELALGRLTRTDAVGAFRSVGGGRWTIFGYASLVAAFLILSFYCVVGGWTVGYLFKALTGDLLSPAAGDFKAQFEAFTGDPVQSVVFFAIFLVMTAGVIAGGVQKGIERTSKVLMPLLFILMLVMIVRSVTLPGAMEGIRFFLVPDIDKITPKAMVSALGFACFSLSLGFGAMLTYGSYMDKQTNLVRSAAWVIFLQTMCSILAGFMVLPAVFAFGMTPGEGAGLSYITLPAVFASMPGGNVFAVTFFLLLLVAALTSSVSIVEPLVAFLIDQYGTRRVVACALVGVLAFLAGLPSAWSHGAGDVPILWGKTPFALVDSLTSDLMLPVNVLATCVLMGWFANREFISELFTGNGRDMHAAHLVKGIVLMCRYVAPVAIVLILVASIL